MNEMKMWSSQLGLRFKQSQSKPVNCFQGFNGIRTQLASALALQCSTNWAMKTHTLGAGQFVEFIVPVKGMRHMNIKWTADIRMKWRCDHRSCDCDLSNRKVSLKKCFPLLDHNPYIVRSRCRRSQSNKKTNKNTNTWERCKSTEPFTKGFYLFLIPICCVSTWMTSNLFYLSQIFPRKENLFSQACY